MNIVGDWADTLAEKILGAHCACYAEAWPAHTCANEAAEVAKLIREFFAAARLVVAPEEPTQEMIAAGTEARWRSAVRSPDCVEWIYKAMLAAVKEPLQCPES